MKNSNSNLNENSKQEGGFRPTSRSLPIALLRARESVMIPIRNMLLKSGITEQQWRVLRVVEENGEIEQTAIANDACLQLPSLTRILRTMEGEGLVERKTDEADRRRSLVSITQKGRQVIDNHLSSNNDIFKALELEFGQQKMETLLDLLEELREVKQ